MYKAPLYIFWLVSLLVSTVAVGQTLSSAQLITALQGGGHIIYMRHGLTDRSQQDQSPFIPGDCTRQRNLSAAGRQQSTDTGLAIKALAIPVGPIFTSSYCRTQETAQLAFGQFQMEPGLNFSISKNKEEARALGQRLKALMTAAETENGNVVFVGHTSNLRDGLGVWPKPEGVVVVFHQQEGQVIYDGMIEPGAWPEP